MQGWARAAGWAWAIFTVLAAAIVVTVGAFRARHNATDLSIWVEWATIAAVPIAALGGLPALLDKIAKTREPWRDRRTAQVTGGWRIVPVSLCSPHDVRVHTAADPAAALPTYVMRDHDDLLRSRLRAASQQGGFLLITGGSATGKSRSMFEAVREVLRDRDWQILLPVSPDGVRNALVGGHIKPRTVVWLDDTPLEKYITATADGLSSDVIRAALARQAPVVIIDSIWLRRYQALIAQPHLPPGGIDVGDPAREARDALLLAGEPILVKDEFSNHELVRAKVLAKGDKRLADALSDTHFGITQSLAGARALLHRYHDAQGDMPFAYAVMTAAVDACRLGHRGPFTQEFLQAAAIGYLSSPDRAATMDGHPGSRPGWFSDALAYAADTDANPGHVAPLVPAQLDGNLAGRVGYYVADYLLQHMLRERRHIQVPASTWEALLVESTVPPDLAHWLFEHGQMDELRLRADAGDRRARELLVDWLVQEGQIPELRQRADAGDDGARRLLAGWLLEQGQLSEAIEAIRPLADASDHDARRLLAEWLSQQNEVEQAIEAIRPLADAGDDGARRLLAGWLLEQGQLSEAIEAIRPLADAGDHDARRLLAGWLVEANQIGELSNRADDDDAARSMLARWLHDEGQVDAAIAAITPLADAGDAAARHLLSRWLHKQGQVDAAIAAITPLADAGDAAARSMLADWLLQHGLLVGLRRRADAGDEAARSRLAGWLLDHGRIDELRDRAAAGDEHAKLLFAGWAFEQKGSEDLRRRAEDGDADARFKLAVWLYERNRVDEAISAIMPLADAPGADTDSARTWLADRLYERDAVDELRERADRGDHQAEEHLVSWLLDHGRNQELRQWSGAADHVARGRMEMREAVWLRESDRLSEAITKIELLAAAGHEAACKLLPIWLAERDQAKAGGVVQ